ncbi:hypothetical protein [Paraburkholderia sp.]|uniref:hypothetical protein n=1 Tax=Paraburkholderia sp. TaxID=1926495 RepID=UPI0034250260
MQRFPVIGERCVGVTVGEPVGGALIDRTFDRVIAQRRGIESDRPVQQLGEAPVRVHACVSGNSNAFTSSVSSWSILTHCTMPSAWLATGPRKRACGVSMPVS